MFGSSKFSTFVLVSSPPPGTAFLKRRIRAANGDWLSLQRVVPLSGGGMRGYYFSPRIGIRAIDRSRVTRVVRQTRDRVWLA